MTPLSSLITLGGKLLDKIIPDKGQRDEAKARLNEMALKGELDAEAAGVKTMLAEMGGGWLQRNWRPITMLTFVALIVAHWVGWTSPNLSKDEVLGLLQIVQIGLGGYVVGRSAEKAIAIYKGTTHG